MCEIRWREDHIPEGQVTRPDLLTLPAVPAFTRHLRRNPGLGQLGNGRLQMGQGLARGPSRPQDQQRRLPWPGNGVPGHSDMGPAALPGSPAATWLAAPLQPPEPWPAGDQAPLDQNTQPGWPPISPRSQINYKGKRKPRQRVSELGEKTNTRPHSGSFCLKAVQKPDVCFTRHALHTSAAGVHGVGPSFLPPARTHGHVGSPGILPLPPAPASSSLVICAYTTACGRRRAGGKYGEQESHPGAALGPGPATWSNAGRTHRGWNPDPTLNLCDLRKVTRPL